MPFCQTGFDSCCVLWAACASDNGDKLWRTIHQMKNPLKLVWTNHAVVHLMRFQLKKLPKESVGNLVMGRGIQIFHYIPSNIPILSQNVLKPYVELPHPRSLPMSTDLDLIWHCGWFFQDESEPRLNWGFMKNVNMGEYQPQTDICMLPIINLNPGDKSCILSTLSFVADQAVRLNIVTPCITLDQPLFIKAVEVFECHKLNMVCRLGGFQNIL